MGKYFFWLLFSGILIFTRFYNLDITARFTEDESKDLVGMHQIFVDKKLTLVGPTNEQGTKVFSSLTFYMLLPAAIIGKFDPISSHYGAAFWGIIVALLIVYFTNINNPKVTFLVAILTLVWFPLLETSRWAWNPNLIPFWIILSLLLLNISRKYGKFLAGISFGLAVHSHYYSIFAVVIFMVLYSLPFIFKKKYFEVFYIFLGFAMALLPFIIFDLRHAPGIFTPNLFSQSKSVSGSLDINLIFTKFFSNISGLMMKYTQTVYLAVPLAIICILLIVEDLKKRSFSLVFIAPWFFQSFLVALIPQFFPHYLIPGLIFFTAWVIYKRTGPGKILSRLISITLILSGAFSVLPQLTKPTSTPNIAVTRRVEQIIKNEIIERDLKNVNIAVLGSVDQNTAGKKYRDLLLVDGNIHIRSKDEYSLSDHLFVISTSEETSVRSDQASEMHRFRNGPLVGLSKIENSNWVVYHFTRGI